MSDYIIPDDLLSNVLLRLPLVSLLRSRWVSKSWRALIDSPYFIRLHSSKKYSLKPDSAAAADDDDIVFVAFSRDKFYTSFNNPVDSSTAIATRLDFPLKHSESDTGLVGSCNGLICLTTPTPDSVILFWNPCTQKYWKLPTPPTEYSIGRQGFFRLGFGYDHANDDYKVVSFFTFSLMFKQSCSSQEETYVYSSYVYSLKQNSWKRLLIGDLPFKFPLMPRDVGALASGALHWIVMAKEWNDADLILSFDLGSEEFRLRPCLRNANYTLRKTLSSLNGSLCLLSYSTGSSVQYRVDLWVMEDYGDGYEPWKKLLSIKIPDGPYSLWYLKPVSYLKNRRKVLLQIEQKKLVVYDLLTKSVEDAVTSLDACVCLGSLVQPNFLAGSGRSEK